GLLGGGQDVLLALGHRGECHAGVVLVLPTLAHLVLAAADLRRQGPRELVERGPFPVRRGERREAARKQHPGGDRAPALAGAQLRVLALDPHEISRIENDRRSPVGRVSRGARSIHHGRGVSGPYRTRSIGSSGTGVFPKPVRGTPYDAARHAAREAARVLAVRRYCTYPSALRRCVSAGASLMVSEDTVGPAVAS